MKKFLALIVTVLVCLSLLVGCSAGGPNKSYDYDYSHTPTGIPENDKGDNYQFAEIKENDFTDVSKTADSYFSLNRNTSGYSLMRRQINEGAKIHPSSVRIEDYVNYFNYNYARPTGNDSLALGGSLFDCPWNAAHKLLRIGVAAEELNFDDTANNVVFLIDVSGSMYGEDRLPLVQQAFTMLLPMLDAADTVSVVTYASGTKVLCEGLTCTDSNKTKIANIIQDIQAGGSTYGEGGINLAYACAEKYMHRGGNNRVILATDGDFNVGASIDGELEKLISDKASKGIDLTVLGFGMGNTRDDTMETLAKNGNGTAAYIDTINEARKVLVEEFSGTMRTVAYDAKAKVMFNAESVDEYRLIGYENSMLTSDQYNNSKTQAGEIGSGHTVTAVYEVALKKGVADGASVAELEVAYKKAPLTDNENVENPEYKVNASITLDGSYVQTDDDKFVACVVEYGLLLRESKYKSDATFADVIARLAALNDYIATDGFKTEFAEVVGKAATLYGAKN